MTTSCKRAGEKAVTAHATWIRASQRRRRLQDDLNYEKAHAHRRPGAAPAQFSGLEHEIKTAKTAEGVAKARYERLMQTYRRQCR